MTAGIIDRFDDVFTRYLDSGFGLLGPEVDHVIILLIAFDVILAGLLWMREAQGEATAALLRKALCVGPVVILLWNPSLLTRILANSYASLGLPPTVSADNVVHPGLLVQTGIQAGGALLAAAEQLQIASLSDHFVEILVFVITASAVLGVFFVLALRMLLAILAFKVTALAAFVLVPFGLFGRAHNLAERLLGAVAAGAIKVLVLTVIVGLGTGLFSHVAHGRGTTPSPDDALMEMLASLALLAVGVFGSESVCRLTTDVLRRCSTDWTSLLGYRQGAFRNLAAPVNTNTNPADRSLVTRQPWATETAATHHILS